jgi:hypothetical protein
MNQHLIVEDMVDDHAFGWACGKRRYYSMDGSKPSGAGPSTQFFYEVFVNIIEAESHGFTCAL